MTEHSEERKLRRETLLQDADLRRREREQQAKGSTFLDHARVDDAGGRFATVNAVTVIGRDGPPTYPQLPGGPWSGQDPVPDEQPFGVDINAVEPIDPPPADLPVGAPGGAADAPSESDLSRSMSERAAPPSSHSKEQDDGS
jgi:hypothetical protein